MARFKIPLVALLLAPLLLTPCTAPAATVATLYTLPGGTDGLLPFAGLLRVGKLFYGTTAYGGKFGRGTVFTVDPATGTETIVWNFKAGKDGALPRAALMQDGGTLYGTTSGGGASNGGTVFSIDPATGAETVIYAFTPASGTGTESSLIKVGQALYGTTYQGGAAGFGTVFKIVPQTGAETTLYSFAGGSDGASPLAGLADVGGTLYGTATSGGANGLGTLFAVNPRTGAETTLYSFTGGNDGGGPFGVLLNVGGLLYGTAAVGGSGLGGTVFAFDPATNTETTTLALSGSLGCTPQAGLIDNAGVLYGTTYGCGAAGYGTVFSVNPATSASAALYAFPGGEGGGNPASPVVKVGGALYGTSAGATAVGAQGTVFKISLAGAGETDLHVFSGPNPYDQSNSALIDVGGTLFGTTADGGAAHAGAVFSVDTLTGQGTTLYAFAGGDDGVQPAGALLSLGGSLYGLTAQGGPYQGGTVFRIDPATGAETALYAFTGGADGANPHGGLLNVSGTLYGATAYGGAAGQGTLFSINLKTGTFSTLYAFAGGNDGANPQAGLIASGGMVYGTTNGGGAASAGTIFQFNPATGVEKVLYSFTGGTDGGYRLSGLAALKGVLYGASLYGGTMAQPCLGAGCGTIFSFNTASSTEATVYSFTGASDGMFPAAAPLAVGRNLYGSTSAGGAGGGGTLYQLATGKSVLTTLYGFETASDPQAALAHAGSVFYGTTSFGGTAGEGTLFSLTLAAEAKARRTDRLSQAAGR